MILLKYLKISYLNIRVKYSNYAVNNNINNIIEDGLPNSKNGLSDIKDSTARFEKSTVKNEQKFTVKSEQKLESSAFSTNQKFFDKKFESNKLLESFEDVNKLRELEVKYLKETQIKKFKDDSNNLLKRVNYSKADDLKNQLSLVMDIK